MVAVTLTLAVAAGACSSGTAEPLGSPALPSSGVASASVTPGQSIWVAVVAEGPEADGLQADLDRARTALGDYLADRVVVKEASCYEGLTGVTGPYVVAVQDVAEHGVHAMYLEITEDPAFYGPVTLAC